MFKLSVKASSAIIAIMGIIALIAALYYHRDASDISPMPSVFLMVFSVTVFGIASWVVFSEKRKSAQTFLFGVMCLCAIPYDLAFKENDVITYLLAISLLLVGIGAMNEGYGMRKYPRIPVADYARGRNYTLCRECEKEECPGCGKKEWV